MSNLVNVNTWAEIDVGRDWHGLRSTRA